MVVEQAHDDLAPHTVSDKPGAWYRMGVHPPQDILCHERVVHGIGMGRGSVVAHVERHHMEVGRQATGNADPVATGAEHAMDEDEVGFSEASEIFVLEDHSSVEGSGAAEASIIASTAPAIKESGAFQLMAISFVA